MAKSAGGTFVKRILDTFHKIGTNGTRVPDGKPPSDIKGNDAISRWHDQHNSIAEYLVAKTLASTAKVREEHAKNAMLKLMQIDRTKLVIGQTYTHVYDNITLNVNPRNPSRRIDRALLLSSLAKHGVDSKKWEAIISDSESESEIPLYLTPSTTVE